MSVKRHRRLIYFTSLFICKNMIIELVILASLSNFIMTSLYFQFGNIKRKYYVYLKNSKICVYVIQKYDIGLHGIQRDVLTISTSRFTRSWMIAITKDQILLILIHFMTVFNLQLYKEGMHYSCCIVCFFN
jgi:hypothetical protein